MKTVGIIGGLGPETTAHFYLDIVFSSIQKNGNIRPPMLIWNVPIPIAIEEQFIKNSYGHEVYISLMTEAAINLERGGADFIVIPCNSAHLFLEHVRESVHVPVISIIEETCGYLEESGIRKPGLLATSATLREDLYSSSFLKKSISPLVPSDEQQNEMGDVINRLVQRRGLSEDKDFLHSVITDLESKGADAIVLACTDLQLVVPSRNDLMIIDTMKILADATMREIFS